MAGASRGTGGGDDDPYTVLGVDRGATGGQIRAAYRAQVARYHPDRHQGNPLEELAAARMTELNRAYEILSDPARRRAYDATRSQRGPGWGAAAGGGGGHDVGRGNPSEAAARRVIGRLVLIATAVAALPFVFRLGGGVVRALGGLVRVAIEGSGAIRGTPVAAGLAAAAVGLLVWLAVRRRRRRRRE